MSRDALEVAAASMATHRCFDPGIESSNGDSITVAANPEPRPSVFIHGDGLTWQWPRRGGLFTPDDARALIASLSEAIEYAEVK